MKEYVLSLKEKQQHNIGFPTFNLLWVTRQILFLMILVYAY